MKTIKVNCIDQARIFNSKLLWTAGGVTELVSELRYKKVRVLGGDVYRVRSNGEPVLSYDNWSIPSNVSASDSLEDSLEYIFTYERRYSGKFLYNLELVNDLGESIILQ